MFFTNSCQEKWPAYDTGYAVMNAYAKSYEKNENVRLLTNSAGFRGDYVNYLALDFLSYKTLNLEQARIFFVLGANNFLKAINQDLEIRPYLIDYPFPYHEITFGVSFVQKNGDYMDKEYINTISLHKGNIFYYYYNKTNNRLEELHSEPYPDAYKIVMGESLESNALKSEPSNNN